MSLLERLLSLLLVPCPACGGTGRTWHATAMPGLKAGHCCWRCHGRGWGLRGRR